MPREMKTAQPLPHCITFLTCMGILEHRLTQTTQLLNPCYKFPISMFPAQVPVSLFMELAGGHGSYLPQLALMDMSEVAVWGARFPGPIHIRDPLMINQYSFLDLIVEVPQPGRYRLVMLLNDQELTQRSLWFGLTT